MFIKAIFFINGVWRKTFLYKPTRYISTKFKDNVPMICKLLNDVMIYKPKIWLKWITTYRFSFLISKINHRIFNFSLCKAPGIFFLIIIILMFLIYCSTIISLLFRKYTFVIMKQQSSITSNKNLLF